MRSIFSFSRRPERDETPLTYEESLRFDLRLAKWELDNAYAGFDYVTEPDLIDCYIFKLNAAMKRYKYLLEKFNALQKETLPAPELCLQAAVYPVPPEACAAAQAVTYPAPQAVACAATQAAAYSAPQAILRKEAVSCADAAACEEAADSPSESAAYSLVSI